MNRKFQPASALEKLNQLTPGMGSWGQRPQLPLDHDVTLYPRVSTPKQLDNVSSEMQLEEDGKLLQLALSCGWKPEQIHHPKDDMALSGRIKMEDRPAFKKMLQDIISGEVKAVIAVEVDRLFRDKWGTEYSKFMEICEKYGVLVICPDMVYDFRDQYAVKRFRDRCVAAWEYLEYQIYGKMIGAKDFLARTCRYIGGFIPVGFIVDRRKKLANGTPNPQYRKYVIYKPHAEIVLRLFKRYRELNGKRWLLYRELAQQPFVFPDVEDWVETEGFFARTCMKKVPGGYKIGVNALGLLLSNVAYIGYWTYNNVLISTASHDPIIPPELREDLFWFAFNRHSPINPDGTPNENYVGDAPHRYTQPGNMKTDAMLKYIIKSADPRLIIGVKPRYTRSGERTELYLYEFHTSLKYATHCKPTYMLSTQDVDGVFWSRLVKHLESVQDFDVYASIEKENQEEVDTQKKEIQTQIDACERAMKKLIQRLVKLEALKDEENEADSGDGEDGEDEFIMEIRKEYNRLGAEKKRQEERLNRFNGTRPHYASQMLTYRELILELRDKLHEYTTIEERLEIVDIFATSVVLGTLSPRVYAMEIYWRDTTWGVDQLVIGRQGNPSVWWTKENDELLREHYPTATRVELTNLFPDRPVGAIRRRAAALGVKKIVEDRANGKLDFPEDLSLRDREVMERFGLCWECCKVRNESKKEQACGLHGGNNGGEHGAYLACYSGLYGSFIASVSV